MKNIFLIFILLFSVNLLAEETNLLDKNCEPKTIAAKIKYKYDSVSFYQNQIKAIMKDRKNYLEVRKMEAIIYRQNKETSDLEAKHLEELGVPQYKDPEMDKILSETDDFLKKTQLEIDDSYLNWYAKCLDYSKKKAGVN